VGVWTGSRDLFLNFGNPLHLWKGKVRDFKFGARIDRQAYKPKHAKVGQRVSRRSHDISTFSTLQFRIFIVSAVNICKQCLQTASASGVEVSQSPRHLPGLRSWTPLGDFYIQTP